MQLRDRSREMFESLKLLAPRVKALTWKPWTSLEPPPHSVKHTHQNQVDRGSVHGIALEYTITGAVSTQCPRKLHLLAAPVHEVGLLGEHSILRLPHFDDV